ncbi:hypothetical protein [Streptomyces chattanoogensis]|uniref:Uncharacterized protein n=1 Tax=Streptomyces chattanoogensis TaxID=66876 RepID=A0A0N0XQW0_9ACTN|nr:hypothetical protein [Streptomyces chattanoogensis]KPC58994.1 hypothetical protein ADL29_38215 [Streptomyces chattanoogensis]
MGRVAQLFRPLAAVTARGAAASAHAPPASGFLTIGASTYIDPAGHYPLTPAPDGTPTLVVNDTDHHVTVITERDGGHDPTTDIVLAPGDRTETHRGRSVQVGWGRVMGAFQPQASLSRS